MNRRSILCEVSSFDITKNIPQDMMHLLLEGAFPLHLKLLQELYDFMHQHQNADRGALKYFCGVPLTARAYGTVRT